MISSLRTYGLAPTLIAVPAGLTCVAVTPPHSCAGMFVKYQSGGTLAVMPNASGLTVTSGYLLLSGEQPLNIDGPAQFFLAAGGATAVAAVMFKRTAGFSNVISGG